MLIRFSFKNFKSFKNENVLDMEATSIKEHEYNVVKKENINLLKVAAIYGANASGKTNVLQAFDFMKKRILVSDDSKKNSPIDEDNVYSFMINNEPISLEVEILAKNNKIYKYGFDVLKDSIVSEWLYIKKINKFYSIFEREKNNVTMKSNNKISGLVNIDERTLFLNIYSKIDKDNEDFNNVYDWFVNANYLDLGNPRFEDFINTRISLKILSDENYKKELLRFIKTFDSGIEGIKTTPDSIEEVQNNNRVVKVELILCNEHIIESETKDNDYFFVENLKYYNFNGNTIIINNSDEKTNFKLYKGTNIEKFIINGKQKLKLKGKYNYIEYANNKIDLINDKSKS